MYEDRFVVAVLDGNGEIKVKQPFMEFMQGKRNIEILNYYTGRKLFDILYDDLGLIHYEDNKIAFKTMFYLNPERTTMSLLGKIAEAVIVRRCNEDYEVNKRWLSVARRKRARDKTAERFRAVGTGLAKTRRTYPKIYNPNDTQRDIVWVDENGQRAMMKMDGLSGIEAGLQVKVSRNGLGYFFQELCELHYEVPVVYFDICHDYAAVARKLISEQRLYRGPDAEYTIEEDFVAAGAIDYEGYQEVCFYEDLVMALIEQKITVEELLDRGEVLNSPTFRNALLSTALSQIPIQNEIQQ